ncbi:MAG TPA: universal stress protein, partial [Paracoccaceae bacterium]|nr:universal stress protein [Paracoccaceae bacterium]
MSIKNILVAFNASNGARSALDLAKLMAKKYDAHLTGVLTHGLPAVLYSYGSHLPQLAMDQLEDADREHRAKVRNDFLTATTDCKTDTVHFMDVFGEADEKLMEVARTFDIVIMGTPEKDYEFPHMAVHPDVVARNSGRPVIVVPAGYRTESLGDVAVIAWDGRRAAARAVADAMNVLENKSNVTVLSVSKPDQTDLSSIDDLLARHGINFTNEVQPQGAETIASRILG